MLEQLDTKEKRKQFYSSYFIFMINGMLALSIGSLLPFIRDAKGLDYAFCGMLVSLHSVGNLVSSFTAGLLPAVLGRKKSILVFQTFFVIAFLLILYGNSRLGLILAFIFTGLARGATSNFNNTLINRLLTGKAWALNGLHAMFSIGAFLFPILLLLLTMSNANHWIYAAYFMLAAGIGSFLLYFLMPMEEDLKQKKKGKMGGFSFFKEPFFYLCTCTLFFYLCAEQGVIGWLITYFKDTGLLSNTLSQAMASILWIMILFGRLTTAWLSTKVSKGKLLLCMGLGFVGFFFLLLFGRTTPLIVLGIMGFGYSMAGIYPTCVSLAGTMIKKYDMAWSYMLTFASFGSILMPSIIGSIAAKSGIVQGMASIAAVVIFDLGLIVALVRYQKKHME